MRGTAWLVGGYPEKAYPDLLHGANCVRGGLSALNVVQCLYLLSGAEYSLGLWDDAVVHGELAMAASEAGRTWEAVEAHLYADVGPARPRRYRCGSHPHRSVPGPGRCGRDRPYQGVRCDI